MARDETWKQGRVFDTPYIRGMHPEDRKVLESVEEREIYANFNESDRGRSRQLVAKCRSAKDAQNIIRCREIVRRLAELGTIGDRALMYQLWVDADHLWSKMQEEAKGDKGA